MNTSDRPYASISDEQLEAMLLKSGWAESERIYEERRRRLISRLERGWRPVSVKDQNRVIDAVTWFKIHYLNHCIAMSNPDRLAAERRHWRIVRAEQDVDLARKEWLANPTLANKRNLQIDQDYLKYLEDEDNIINSLSP